MKDFATREDIDIDELLETVIADPSRADEVKTLLRRRLSPRPSLALVDPAAVAEDGPDPDEYWDNMPV